MAVTWKKLAYEDDVALKTLWAAKGTLVGASGANTPAGLAVGADGQFLKALAAEVTGLVWGTADAPDAHAATHEDAGADEISIAGLVGESAELTTHKAVKAGIATLGHVIVEAASDIDIGAGGELTLGGHKTRHQDAGDDEISVVGLAGLLADDQHVLDAEVTAVIEATPLNDLAAADGAVDFNDQEALDIVLPNSAEPPATAVVGKIYMDTDLSAYICTVAV